MSSIYKSYVRAFTKFAERHLQLSAIYKQVSRFAIILTQKANQLLARAALNNIDIIKLQKELFETGSQYVRKFVQKMQRKQADQEGDNKHLKPDEQPWNIY